MEISQRMGLGFCVKLTRSKDQLGEWEDTDIAQSPVVGFDMGGTATDVTFGAGTIYRPSSSFSFGLSVDNLGPDISYRAQGLWGEWYGYVAELPTLARLGASWTSIENRVVRLRVMPELTKVLVDMSSDTTGGGSRRQSGAGWRDVWKAVGLEATALGLLSVRLGYFEDLTNQRGGLVFWDAGETYHYGVWDVLTRKNPGDFKRVGLCWGFGIGYQDYFRVDVSSDAAIYDFPTSNWKLSLVADDIVGGIRELRQGHVPWEE